GPECDGYLQERNTIREPMVMREKPVGLLRLLVARMLFFSSRPLDVLLLRRVPLDRRLNRRRRRLAGSAPDGAGLFFDVGLDPFGLVIGPLIGRSRLKPPRLRLQYQGLVHRPTGSQGSDGAERREQSRRQRNIAEQSVERRLVNGFLKAVDVDLRFLGHARHDSPIASP